MPINSMKKEVILIILILILIFGLVIFYWFNQKHQPESININEEAIGLDFYEPINYEHYQAIGFSREQIDTLFNRLRELDQILKDDPDDYESILKMAGFLKMLREYEDAMKVYHQAIKAYPGFGAAYAELADIYVYPLGQYDQAVDYYQKAIEFSPYRSDYYRWLADLYVSQFPEKKSEIESLILAGVEETETNAEPFYNYLITFFQREGNLDKAIEYAEKSLAINPDNDIYRQILDELRVERRQQ